MSSAQKMQMKQHQMGPSGLVQALDARLSNSLYRAGSALPRSLYLALEWGCDGIVWLFIALAALLAPSASLQQRALWANFLLAWLVDLALVGSLKALVRRTRPVYNRSHDFVVVVAVDHYSFPSGHSSRASFVAGFALVCLARTQPGLCAAAVAWAATTALSRALMGRHYLFDVLAGLAVGAVTVGIVTAGSYEADGFVLSQRQVAWALSRAAQRLAALGLPLRWLE